MLRKGLALTAALGLVVASAPIAKADDLCFHYQTSGGGTLVARGATLPNFNTCQPLALFESLEGGGLGSLATGSICRDATDGITVVFQYTLDSCVGIAGSSYFESATCRLQLQDRGLPTTSSSCRGTANGSGFLAVDDAVLFSCSGMTVPGGGGGQCVAGQ